jgi:MATE family multidrug resistance protein
LILAVSPLARYLFILAGQSSLQVGLGYEYFQYIIFGSLFLVLRYALSGFFLGIGRTRLVMLANLAGMLANLPANYVLIYGKLGFPALGLKGAAIGTILGSALSFLILLASYLNRTNRREFATHRSFHMRGATMRTLVRFGTPAGVEMLLNVAAFNLFVQFMYSYGTGVAAAVTIAFNWDIVAFIPMLGMSFATTSLVGQFVGARDFVMARRAAYLSLRVAWVYSASMVVVFLAATGVLVRTFVSGLPGDTAEISRLAAGLIRLASIYTLADSAQLIFAGALRGAGDTRWVMRVSVGLHWVFSGVAIVMIRFLRISPVAAWMAFIVFIVLLGIFMYLRFRGDRWTDIRMIA